MEVGVREVGEDGGSRNWGSTIGRDGWVVQAAGSSGPDVRAGLPHTGRAGRAFARPDAVVRAGSYPCHTRRVAQLPDTPHVWQLSGP